MQLPRPMSRTTAPEPAPVISGHSGCAWSRAKAVFSPLTLLIRVCPRALTLTFLQNRFRTVAGAHASTCRQARKQATEEKRDINRRLPHWFSTTWRTATGQKAHWRVAIVLPAETVVCAKTETDMRRSNHASVPMDVHLLCTHLQGLAHPALRSTPIPGADVNRAFARKNRANLTCRRV